MGKKFLLTLLVFVLFPIAVFAQLSARTQLFLEQQKSIVPERDNAPARMRIQTGKVQSETGETETVQCFISLKEKSLKEIESEGAVINAKFDDIVLATVPVDKIEAISKKRFHNLNLYLLFFVLNLNYIFESWYFFCRCLL